jgi:hypothetical protein
VYGEDGRQALEIAIALRESHRRGGVKVNLPLEDRKFVRQRASQNSSPASQFIAHLPYFVRKITFFTRSMLLLASYFEPIIFESS